MIKIEGDKCEMVRKLFQEWCESHFHPNMKHVSELVDVNYTSLVNFKNSKRNLGEKNLQKILDFLQGMEK